MNCLPPDAKFNRTRTVPLLYLFLLCRKRHELNPFGSHITRIPDDELQKLHDHAIGRLKLLARELIELLQVEDQDLVHEDVQILRDELGHELRMHNRHVAHLHFLFEDYKCRRWYYAVIECLRRLALTGLLVVFAHNPSSQLILGMLFSHLAHEITAALKPLNNPNDEMFYIWAQKAITGTFFLVHLRHIDYISGRHCSASVIFLLTLVVASQVWIYRYSLFEKSFADARAQPANKFRTLGRSESLVSPGRGHKRRRSTSITTVTEHVSKAANAQAKYLEKLIRHINEERKTNKSVVATLYDVQGHTVLTHVRSVRSIDRREEGE